MTGRRRDDNRGTTLKSTLILIALALALPATAHGHASIAMDGETIVYVAIDPTNRSSLTVTVGQETVRFRDPTVDGGIAPGPCDPGAVDRGGAITEVICPRRDATAVRADVGPLDDSVEVQGEAMSTFVLGGAGADRLVGGNGPDTLDGGAGRDDLRGGDGDDELRSRDGAFEITSCGSGTDRAYLDAPDVGEGCETVEHTDPPPPPEPPPGEAPQDTTPPAVEASAARRQRLTRPLRATTVVNEAATVSATATIRAGRRRYTFVSPQQRASANEPLRLTLRAPRSTIRRLRRARRALYATITVVAIDDAANSAAARTARIRLRRQ